MQKELGQRVSYKKLSAAYLLFAILITLPVWLNPTHTWIGFAGDPELQIWYLKWMPWALSHGQNPLYTNLALWPHGANMMWNVAMFFPSLVLWPVTALGGPILSYNVLLTVGLFLTALAAHAALRYFVQKEIAVVLGTLVYVLSPYIIGQSWNHVNLAVGAFPAVTLLLFCRTVTKGKAWQNGLWMGAAALAQFFFGEEVFTSTVLIGILLLLLLAVLFYRYQVRQYWRTIVVFGGACVSLFLLVAGFFIGYQLLGPNALSGVLRPDAASYHVDLANLIFPVGTRLFSPDSLPVTGAHFATNLVEWNGYIGLPILALIGYTSYKLWRMRLVRFCLVALVLCLVLSLGTTLFVNGVNTHIPLPGALLSHIPFFDDVLLDRLSLYTDFFIAVFMALIVNELNFGSRITRKQMAVALLVFLTWVPVLPLPIAERDVPAFFTATQFKMQGSPVVAVFPFVHDISDVDVMLWQASGDMTFRMPDGYIVNNLPGPWAPGGPPDSEALRLSESAKANLLSPNCTDTQRTSLKAEFQKWGVQFVIVGPMPHEAALVQNLSCILGQQPEARGGVYLWNLHSQ